MCKKVKEIYTNVKNGITNMQSRYIKIIIIVILVLMIFLLIPTIILRSDFLSITCAILLGGTFVLFFCYHKRQKDEEEKQNEEYLRKKLGKLFTSKDIQEVCLSPHIKYPHYEKKYYDDLEELIFLHMLVAVQGEKVFRTFAEYHKEDGELILYLICGQEHRRYDEFPHKLFLRFFTIVE